MANLKGGFFSTDDGSQGETINEVGKKCLLSLSDSYVGDLLSRPEYGLLMAINPQNERNPFFSSLAKLAVKKKESIANLACSNEGAKDARDASYCVACQRGSEGCLQEVQKLCEEGYVHKNGYQLKGVYNYHANFFWKRLHENAPTICQSLQLLSTSEGNNDSFKRMSKSAIADVITAQCEEDRSYISCY
ncbi:hypothetical protein BSKO_07554 [Bryopsis sp. KO-2023]|nr:hypothetical protein BSKO_07554 [Bryopsis sp. KO-2023]